MGKLLSLQTSFVVTTVETRVHIVTAANAECAAAMVTATAIPHSVQFDVSIQAEKQRKSSK